MRRAFSARERRQRRQRAALIAIAGACLLAFAVPAAASAATDTWTGGEVAGAGASNWGDPNNWMSGTIPMSGDSLVFPTLTCSPSTTACRNSNNSLGAGFNVTGITLDAGAGYTIGPPGTNGITLGSGGLTVRPAASPTGTSNAFLLPITLGAPQTWSIDGNQTGMNPSASVAFLSNVTGPAQSLGMNLAHQAFVSLNNTTDVGALTITGASTSNTGNTAFQNGTVGLGSGGHLNPSGASVTLTDAGLLAESGSGAGPTIGGPFSEVGGNLQVGSGGPSGGSGQTLTFGDNATMDQGSVFSTFIQPHSGGGAPVAGTDNGEILGGGTNAASKTLNLSNSHLQLFEGNFNCGELHQGDVYTLINWPGTIQGTFAGGDGATVPLGCSGTSVSVLINYTAHTVTATVIGSQAGSTTSLSSSNATPTTGQTFTLNASVAPSSGTGPAPTGTVTFTDGNTGTVICDHVALTVPSSGNTSTASCNTSASTTGAHDYVASYGGDANYAASAKRITLNVQAASSGGGGGTTTGGGGTTTNTTTTTTTIISSTPPTAAQINAALLAAQGNFLAQLGTFSTQGLARLLSVTYTVSELTPGRYVITITFIVQGKINGVAAVKRITLGTATVTETAAGKFKIKITLSKKGRAALKKAAKARLTVSTTFTPTLGTPQRVQGTVTIRAKKTTKKKK